MLKFYWPYKDFFSQFGKRRTSLTGKTRQNVGLSNANKDHVHNEFEILFEVLTLILYLEREKTEKKTYSGLKLTNKQKNKKKISFFVIAEFFFSLYCFEEFSIYFS